MPKIRPILFNGEMVRAVLDGRKTQTRRPIKIQCSHYMMDITGRDRLCIYGKINNTIDADKPIYSPLGKVGDRLYVRESFRPVFINGGTGGYGGTTTGEMQYKATPGGGNDKTIQSCSGLFLTDAIVGGFTRKAPAGFYKMFRKAPLQMDHGWEGAKWKPSIHMPKWASRIPLEITAVRVERVQDITEDDAIAEGVVEDDNYIVDVKNYGNGPVEIGGTRYFNGITDEGYESAGDSFADLWNSIYKNWDANPWVWVCEFEVVK